ncbi:hypothetical protein C0992_005296, partial [Termitomyces sp. T32_za158]
KVAAVKAARAGIAEALAEAEAQEAGRGMEAYLEQRWDMESVRGGEGPRLVQTERRVKASRSVSQELAERAAKEEKGTLKSVEELVPEEFHDFLDVFSKDRADRLPQH